MRSFMDDDFLLTTNTAKRLYHEAAAGQPIFDYHCHLSPREIAEDKRFANLAEMWLGGDHYKWRAMRAAGVEEKYVTGNAAPYDKFLAWARTMEDLVGNPLYHWTHLELRRYFGIADTLNESSAPKIWEKANALLSSDALSVYGIFNKFKVRAVGTTDDPVDDLAWHKRIAEEGVTETKVLPSFRPDKAVHLEKEGFAAYAEKLGAAAGVRIEKFDDLLEALRRRVDYFDAMGCRASDHALEYPPYEPGELPVGAAAEAAREKAARAAFATALGGGKPDQASADAYKTAVLAFLGGEYARRGWAMQLHLAAIRNVNSRAFAALGPDTGYDAVNDRLIAANLARLLDLLASKDALPKTILYSLNPKDYYPLGTIMGGFQGGVPGKMQLGSAWWFCDHKDGMEDQLRTLAAVGLLPRFIGMLTDSRSFLSYPRHEYFRRILCALLGRWAEEGEIPGDQKLLDRIVADISFGNAERYFAR